MLKDLKPILFLLGRFFGIYFVLIALYQFYLNFYDNVATDPLSRIIAEQSNFCLGKMGYDAQLVEATDRKGTYFYINEVWASIMVEGCNAISIMILFLAFIFAFYQGVKTFWFALAGLFFLYIVNVFRISLLNVLFVDYPEWGHSAHDYLFPAIIYGGVIILWFVWIKFFVIKKKDE